MSYADAPPRLDIIVARIVERKGRRFVQGEMFSNGVVARHSSIELGHDDDRCGRALARYLLADAKSGSISRAATLLGMAPASLQEWIGRRPLSVSLKR